MACTLENMALTILSNNVPECALNKRNYQVSNVAFATPSQPSCAFAAMWSDVYHAPPIVAPSFCISMALRSCDMALNSITQSHRSQYEHSDCAVAPSGVTTQSVMKFLYSCFCQIRCLVVTCKNNLPAIIFTLA